MGSDIEKYGIEPGLVAKRRYELLINGFNGNQGILHAAADQPRQESTLTRNIDSSLLEHPTILPSEEPPRPPSATIVPAAADGLFFAVKNPPEQKIKTKMDSIDLATLLITKVNQAKTKYAGFCKDGSFRRTKGGWLTNIRHKENSIKNLDLLGTEFQSEKNPELVLEYLNSFFTNPKTTYNNHSFSAFLLDELNVLLKAHSLRGVQPLYDVTYNRSHWTSIHGQCQELAMRDERSSVMII